MSFAELEKKIKETKNKPNPNIPTIGRCILESIDVNYAPNGWSTYQDGYPVQTRLTLQFKETEMVTKEHFKNTNVYNNYTPTPGSLQDFDNSGGQNGSGNYDYFG